MRSCGLCRFGFVFVLCLICDVSFVVIDWCVMCVLVVFVIVCGCVVVGGLHLCWMVLHDMVCVI